MAVQKSRSVTVHVIFKKACRLLTISECEIAGDDSLWKFEGFIRGSEKIKQCQWL